MTTNTGKRYKIASKNTKSAVKRVSLTRRAEYSVRMGTLRDKKASIIASGSLNWSCSLAIYSNIYKSFKNGVRRFEVNLSGITKAKETGIMPLVANCDQYRRLGCTFYFLWPEDHEVSAVFRSHYWSSYLSGHTTTKSNRLTRTTGLIKFDSHEDLNEKMNKALAICIKGTVFTREALRSFEWSFNEILDNVLTHSEAGYGYFEVTWGIEGKVSFTVCDCGVGIPKNIRQSFREVRSDHDALSKAIERGITSTKEGQGNGLAGTFNIVQSAKGILIINSGFGTLKMSNGSLDCKQANIPFRGTYVNFVLPSNAEVELDKSIWGFDTYSIMDYGFNSDDTDLPYIKLSEHAVRFGNRPTGKSLRNILDNLTRQHPGSPIIIDFDRVEIISSSFGDEFLGKFASSVGIINFIQVIRLKNLNQFVGNILNHVITQRLVQDYQKIT